MTHLAASQPVRQAGPERSLWRVGLARLMRRLAQELRLRRDARQLMALSDAMLKDLGVSRSEIEGAVRHGRADPPTA